MGGAWIVGAYLRLWQLGQQIVVGDEVHALKSAGSGTVRTILAEEGLPDVSIPMALWDHLLIQTVGLTEWGLRLPVLLAGLLTLVILSVFTWRRINPLAGVLVAWLAALSPQLVMFSRFARPYMPIMLLSLLTIVFWQQQLVGKRHRAWLAVLCTLLAISLSPTCAPALAAAHGCGLLLLIRQNGWSALRPPRFLREGRVLGPLSFAVAAVALAAGLSQTLRLLPIAHLLALRTRWKGTPVDWEVVLEHVSFTSHSGLQLWFAFSLLLGLFSPRPRARALGLAFVLMTLTQVACVILFVPWGGRAFSIMRYLLVLYPIALLLIATGIETQLCALRRVFGGEARWGGLWAPAALVAISASVLNTGPLPHLFQKSNSFTGMWPEHLTDPADIKPTPYAAWPRFYRFLSESSEDLTVMEAPSISTSPASLRHYASYQVRHRQRVVLLNRRAVYKGKAAGVELSSIRPLRQSIGLGLQGIDYIIVHRDFVDERRRLMELSSENSGDRATITKTDRELKAKAAQLVEEFDGDGRYLPLLRTDLVAIFAVTPGALRAYKDWDAAQD
jgi:hypothetical protein